MWAKWSRDRDIPLKIPKFLHSDFQEVRLTAVMNLKVLFSNEGNLDICEKQKKAFQKICDNVSFIFF